MNAKLYLLSEALDDLDKIKINALGTAECPIHTFNEEISKRYEGDIQATGQATHYVICIEDQIMAIGELINTQHIIQGNSFNIRFDAAQFMGYVPSEDYLIVENVIES